MCDDGCEEVVVTGSHLAFEAKGVLSGRCSDEVEGDVFKCGEVCGSVVGAHTAFVVAEDHVHDPMQAVLD